MTMYSGACQDLGFLCEWEATALDSASVVLSLVDHLNAAHQTGATSPALSALISRHVTELPDRVGEPTHVQERAT